MKVFDFQITIDHVKTTVAIKFRMNAEDTVSDFYLTQQMQNILGKFR